MLISINAFLCHCPSLISYQGQLSCIQFGLVSCSEGELLGRARTGEVGKGVNDGQQTFDRELWRSGEPSVHSESSGEAEVLQVGTSGESAVHLWVMLQMASLP